MFTFIFGIIVVLVAGVVFVSAHKFKASPWLVRAVAALIGIVIGIVFAVQRTGLAAGLATIFLGQMALGVAMDALGWSGVHAAPVDPRRIAGLLLTGAGIVLLVPRG